MNQEGETEKQVVLNRARWLGRIMLFIVAPFWLVHFFRPDIISQFQIYVILGIALLILLLNYGVTKGKM